MTAIVSIYVSGLGFAVGADGLRTDARTGATVAEDARKIFVIEGDGIRLIYAWAGASSLFLGDGREFSFLDESANIGNALAINKPESIEEYVRQFAVGMYSRLQALRLPDGRLSHSPDAFPREEIAHILFVGYYNGKPYRTGVRFSQSNSLLQSPFMDELIESPDNFDVFSGSEVILEQFQPMTTPESLQEAADLIRKYIQACIDSRSKYSDCMTIGGQVHVATVTPEEFKWVIPPID
jgi:hypothetical protein